MPGQKKHELHECRVADLIPYANNSRIHSDEQVAQVAASIQEYGFTNPVLIGNNTKGGDIVLDTFGGSGSTLIACDKTGRISRLVELDPIYCDVIINRWQNYTGQQAVHADGRLFSEMDNG